MDAPIENPEDRAIKDLFHQLVNDGRDYVGAEVALYKEVALYRIGKARTGLVALASGILIGLAAVVALIVGLVMGLAVLIGPVLAGLVVAAIAGLAAYLLVRFGVARLAVVAGDADEKAAIGRREQLL